MEDHTTEAILHYIGSHDSEPITERRKCTSEEPCDVLNCPFDYFPIEEHIRCHRISSMRTAAFDDPVPEWQKDSEEHFLNFAFPGQKITPGSVNGRKFEYPGVNSLFQSNQVCFYGGYVSLVKWFHLLNIILYLFSVNKQ